MNKKLYKPKMTVYLAGSSRHIEEDMPYFRHITDIISKHGYTLTYNWVESAYSAFKTGIKNTDMDWQLTLADNLEGLTKADVVIVEGTWYGFAEGYYTALALREKKPVLCVMRDVDLDDRIASGIKDDLFSLRSYKTQDDLEKHMENFLHENMLTSKDLRFNFFLDREINNHLRWASFKTGKTKAEIIRELIDKEIEKSEY